MEDAGQDWKCPKCLNQDGKNKDEVVEAEEDMNEAEEDLKEAEEEEEEVKVGEKKSRKSPGRRRRNSDVKEKEKKVFFMFLNCKRSRML